jgi:hypothetical protein
MILGFLICLALALIGAGAFALCAAAVGGMADDYEDELAAQRTPGMGDWRTVPDERGAK